MSTTSQPHLVYCADTHELLCQGSWTVDVANLIESSIDALIKQVGAKVSINGQAISNMDSAGGLLLLALQRKLEKTCELVVTGGLSDDFSELLALIQSELVRQRDTPSKKSTSANPIAAVGRSVTIKFSECLNFVSFLGHFIVILLQSVKKSHRVRWRAVLTVLDETGYRALPIVALLTLLVGVVMTYQIASQLVTYGANIYVVDVTGMIIFREFAPLVTAIIAAGRTSTAFAAQIGTMKVNEELDALETMAVPVYVRIVLPKVIGLLIALPLLTVWADLFGVFGAMVMANVQLAISYHSFLLRFEHVIGVQQYLAGLIKVPFFALVIALVGSYQGFQVAHNADSVGSKTTKSAVQSIFLIIIVDALFSVIFSLNGI